MSHRDVVVVTGAAGFIGSHMTDLLLEQGYTVRAVDNLASGRMSNLEHHAANPRFNFERMDVRNLAAPYTLFKDAKYVFHFAGKADIIPSIDEPLDYLSVNLTGTVTTLEAARHAGVQKFLYAASSSCYGKDCPVPTREDAPIRPEYPYAFSKYLGEEAVMHWHKVYKIPVISIRIFNAYGLRSRTTGAYGAVFGVFLAQKLAGKPFTVVGDGTQTRDFVHATDLARAFLAAAESDREREIYNVGAGKPQSVNRLTELLAGPSVHLPKRPGEPQSTWADISKIQSELGWKPQMPFEEGVKIMVQNIDLWRDAPVWDPASIEKVTQRWFEALEKVES